MKPTLKYSDTWLEIMKLKDNDTDILTERIKTESKNNNTEI